MEEQKETTFGSTIRAFAFDGDETKFRSWEGKTIALAGSKGFLLALTKAPTATGLTAEEFENGEVVVLGALLTGGGVDATGAPLRAASTTRTPTTAENRKYSARAAAWTYLVASCSDKAYALIERSAGDPFKAWTILQEKYCSTDAEENYPDLAEAFSACKLVEVKRDPELWFNVLDHLNMRIGRINTKYEKDELQMKSHIMNSMSTGYDPVIVKFRGELADTTLTKLRKEIVLQYKSLLKVKGKSTSESALMANVNKHPYKKFKGTCRNCGKIGHKAAECRLKAVEGSDEVGGKGKASSDKSNVTCYNCGEKGHYSNKCTKPKKSKASGDPTSDMAMFVGVTRVVEKEWDKKVDQKEGNSEQINNW